MSSAQPSASDRKFVPVAYGLPCADCGTYYPSQTLKCPTCGSATRGPFTSSGKHVKPRTAQVATPSNPPITGVTERLFSRLAYGLPCAKCGCYYGGDLKECPTCHSSQRGARIFGPQPVKAPVSAAALASTPHNERVRGLGLPCADCGAYYSGDVSACLNCGSRKRGPLASGKRLGPTLVTSAKTVAAPPSPAVSPRPAARTVKTGLPCAKCHSYYDADRDTCPSCGHHERRRIAATLPPVEVAAPPEAVEVHPGAAPVASPSLLSERAASLASEIAELLAQKLLEPDVSEAIASSDEPEEQIQEFRLAPTEAIPLPQSVAEAPEAVLPIPAAEPMVEPPEEIAAMHPELAPAEPPAPVVLEIQAVHTTSAADIAPEVPATPEQQAPVYAFDLAAFVPAASAQHFVVETEPSILNDPDSLAAAISRAVDKAMRALRLPTIEAVPSEPLPLRDAVSTPEETVVANVEAAAPADATSQEVTVTPELSVAPPGPVAPTAPELLPIESVAPLEPEASSYSEQPLAALVAEPAAVAPAPEMPPAPAATEHPAAEAALMLSIPESAWLDCPTCHASYDAALETCPTCAAGASSMEVSEAPMIAVDASPDSVAAAPAQPEIDLDVVRCAVCDGAYLATLATCPACLQASQSVEALAAPVSEAVIAVSEIALVPPVATAPTQSSIDDESMTLIDALDFFEELTRKLRA